MDKPFRSEMVKHYAKSLPWLSLLAIVISVGTFFYVNIIERRSLVGVVVVAERPEGAFGLGVTLSNDGNRPAIVTDIRLLVEHVPSGFLQLGWDQPSSLVLAPGEMTGRVYAFGDSVAGWWSAPDRENMDIILAIQALDSHGNRYLSQAQYGYAFMDQGQFFTRVQQDPLVLQLLGERMTEEPSGRWAVKHSFGPGSISVLFDTPDGRPRVVLEGQDPREANE